MTSVHLVRVRSAVRAACSLLPALLDARQRAQIARLYVQRMQQLVKRGPETQEAKAQKAEARRVLARNTERKYLANRVINDASAGKGIVNRERIDLLRVCSSGGCFTFTPQVPGGVMTCSMVCGVTEVEGAHPSGGPAGSRRS